MTIQNRCKKLRNWPGCKFISCFWKWTTER